MNTFRNLKRGCSLDWYKIAEKKNHILLYLSLNICECIFQVSVSYPSGFKTVVITDEAYKTICKAFIRGSDVDRIIIETISNKNPSAFVNRTTHLIREEAHTICKRGSESLLRKKEYEDFLSFSWDMLESELEQRCSSILTVVSPVVCDINESITEKPFRHIMTAIAVALHGRSQEMNTLQYIVGFVLTHGGCTQRVSVDIQLFVVGIVSMSREN